MWLLKVNIPRFPAARRRHFRATAGSDSPNLARLASPGSQFSVLSSQFSVLSSRFLVPGSWFLVLGSWFSVRNYSVQRLKSPLEGFSPGVHLRGRCHGDRIGGCPARSVLSGAVSTARLSSYLGSWFSKCYSSFGQRSIAILYGGKMWRHCAL
jgi:hypothetical protein